jgi:glycosyltransferase involved in cell wall biosynthesis
VLLGALSYGEGNNGVALSASLVARLLEPECDVAVLTGSHGSGAGQAYELRLFGQRAAIPLLLRLPMGLLGIARQVEQVIASFGPDVIHLQDADLVDPVVRVARRSGVPVIVSLRDARFLPGAHNGEPGIVHGPMAWTRTRSFLELVAPSQPVTWLLPLMVPLLLAKDALVRELLGQARLLLPTSEFLMRGIRQAGLQTPARVLRLVPVPDWEAAAMPAGSGTRFVAVGRLVRGKGFEVLMESFARVTKDLPQAELTLAGEGPQRHRLEQLARRLGCAGHVRFAGNTPYDRMREVYAAASIVVFPSLVPEGFGRVVVEAARVGRAVIASAVGGVPELVEPDCGVLVPPGDVAALAEAMLALARDPKRQERLAANARRRSEVVAGDALRAQLLQVYDEVLGRARAVAPVQAVASPEPSLTARR